MTETPLEPGDLDLASELCSLVQATDLFEYLGVGSDAPAATVREALSGQRRRMQAMQHNPKYREAAAFVLRHYRVLQRVVEHPDAHLAAMRSRKEDAHLPMLQLALQSAMADGRITPQEESFLRQACLQLGISEERYEAELIEQARLHGVVLDARDSPEAARAEKFRAAEGYAWWDAAFTRLLLECIPAGPSDMVDLYCRAGLSASTVLPERPQITWTGVDRSEDRLAQARELLLSQSGAASRIHLRAGSPQQLPVPDESMDYALLVRALPGLQDTRPVLGEAWRVLRPGGRVIVVEPDGFAETFYFRGPLHAYNEAFHALCVAADQRLGPRLPPIARSGLAIGPTLPERLALAGFQPGQVRVHASHNVLDRSFGKLARQLRKYPSALADRVGLLKTPLLRRVLDEVSALEGIFRSDDRGVGGHVLPLFLVVGDKPAHPV